jgi:hypothetical protein
VCVVGLLWVACFDFHLLKLAVLLRTFFQTFFTVLHLFKLVKNSNDCERKKNEGAADNVHSRDDNRLVHHDYIKPDRNRESYYRVEADAGHRTEVHSSFSPTVLDGKTLDGVHGHADPGWALTRPFECLPAQIVNDEEQNEVYYGAEKTYKSKEAGHVPVIVAILCDGCVDHVGVQCIKEATTPDKNVAPSHPHCLGVVICINIILLEHHSVPWKCNQKNHDFKEGDVCGLVDSQAGYQVDNEGLDVVGSADYILAQHSRHEKPFVWNNCVDHRNPRKFNGYFCIDSSPFVEFNRFFRF